MKNAFSIFMLLASSAINAQAISEHIIANWGYTTSTQSTYMPVFCGGSIAPQRSTYQYIKSVAKSSELTDSHYRFTLASETYASELEAQKRSSDIMQPRNRSTKESKLCDIRTSVYIGSTVFFVHTDVGAYRDKLLEILQKFIAAQPPQ